MQLKSFKYTSFIQLNVAFICSLQIWSGPVVLLFFKHLRAFESSSWVIGLFSSCIAVHMFNGSFSKPSVILSLILGTELSPSTRKPVSFKTLKCFSNSEGGTLHSVLDFVAAFSVVQYLRGSSDFKDLRLDVSFSLYMGFLFTN